MEDSKLKVCCIKREEQNIGRVGRNVDRVRRLWCGVEGSGRVRKGSGKVE